MIKRWTFSPEFHMRRNIVFGFAFIAHPKGRAGLPSGWTARLSLLVWSLHIAFRSPKAAQ